MPSRSLIEQICEVPINFKNPIHFSINIQEKFIQKLKKRNIEDKIRIDQIISYIKNNPDLVEKWIYYCEDKRGGFPVYFSKKNNKYEFGGLDKELDHFRPVLISESPELPCSLFIIFELGLFNEIIPFM